MEATQDLPRMGLRQKKVISSTKTDRELFDDLKVDDIWPEAKLVQVWGYLYQKHPVGYSTILGRYLGQFQPAAYG